MTLLCRDGAVGDSVTRRQGGALSVHILPAAAVAVMCAERVVGVTVKEPRVTCLRFCNHSSLLFISPSSSVRLCRIHSAHTREQTADRNSRMQTVWERTIEYSVNSVTITERFTVRCARRDCGQAAGCETVLLLSLHTG